MRSDIQGFLQDKYRALNNMPTLFLEEQGRITDACINLKIVTRKSAKLQESQFSERSASLSKSDALRELQLGTYSAFYENAELEQRDVMEIEKIFNVDDEQNIPKKVAIYGRAGTGKSTLCRFLSVKWQENQLWNDKFDYVIWIPLRDAISCPSIPNTNSYLSTIVRKYCINGMEDCKLILEDIEFSLCTPQNKSRVLFILDGYDEIEHSMTDGMRNLLHTICTDKSWNVIITSRPGAIKIHNEPVNFDLALENVGFTQANIKNYISRFYKSKEQGVLKFIESNQHIHNIAHIPLSLELICHMWTPALKQENYTVTQLYGAIEEKLFTVLNDKRTFRIDAHRQAAIVALLGEIALYGMRERRSITSAKDVQHIVQQVERRTENSNLFKEALALGVIKTVSQNKNDEDNDVYFIHHTFQEYFAGLCIAKGFEGYQDQAEHKVAIQLLKEHKYTKYYEVMWLSVVGSLYEICRKQDNYLPMFQFWDAFENEPRELLGHTHDALRLKLIEEYKSTAKDIPTALRKLQGRLISTSVIRFNLLRIVESDAEPEKRLYAIDAIVKLDDRAIETISLLEKTMLKDKIEGVRLFAAEALLRLGHKSEACVTILTNVVYGILDDNLFVQKVITKQEWRLEYKERFSNQQETYAIAALGRIGHSIPAVQKCLLEVFNRLANVDSKLLVHLDKYFALQPGHAAPYFRLKTSESLIKIESPYAKEAIEFIISCLNSSMQRLAIKILATLQSYKDIKAYLENPSPELEPYIAKITNYKSRPFDYIHTAIGEYRSQYGDAKNTNVVATGASMSALFGSGYALYYGCIMSSVLPIAGGVILGCYGARVLYGLSYGEFKILNPALNLIVRNSTEKMLEEIAAMVEADRIVVKEWSTDGVLTLPLAIRLYSYYCTANKAAANIWLEPMKEITFIYKDPNIFLLIIDKQVADQNKQKLTKNWDETKAVLTAMRQGYGTSISTKILDHYLKNESLDVSTPTEKMALARRIRSNRPMALTTLHKASASGNLDEVIKIVESKEIDINDFNNPDWETPLVMAIRGKHWVVVEYLVDQGADVNICGAAQGVIDYRSCADKPENFISLCEQVVKNSAQIHSTLIERALDYATKDYIMHKSNIKGKSIVLDNLVKFFTGEVLITGKACDIYRLHLENIGSIKRDGIGSMEILGSGADETLTIRLRALLLLYVRLSASEVLMLPALEDAIDVTIAEIQHRLLGEIKILIQTNCLAHILYKLQLMICYENQKAVGEKLEAVVTQAVLSEIEHMQQGNEYILVSQYAQHCIYVAFHKTKDSNVIIRVDNKFIFGCGDRAHAEAPYVVSGLSSYKRPAKQIKSFFVTEFNADLDKERLTAYIHDTFAQKALETRL